MKIKNIELEQVAGFREQWPREDLPELAFVGRSNVGKSSFINSFLGRKSLPRLLQFQARPGQSTSIG